MARLKPIESNGKCEGIVSKRFYLVKTKKGLVQVDFRLGACFSLLLLDEEFEGMCGENNFLNSK